MATTVNNTTVNSRLTILFDADGPLDGDGPAKGSGNTESDVYLDSKVFLNLRSHTEIDASVHALQWDASTNKHFYDENLYDVQNKRWLKKSREPHSKKAVRVFKKILDIDRNYASGVYAFSLKSISPEISYSWLNWYLEDINDFFRKQEIKDTTKSIKFLESKITQTNNIEIRRVFYNIIQEQTKELMLAEVNEEYFIKLIDKPQKAYIKSGPNRFTIVAVTMAITLMMFVFLLAFLSIFNRKILFNFLPFQLKIQKD